MPAAAPLSQPDSLGNAIISPQSVDFGTIEVGSNASQAISVTNGAQPGGNGLDADVGDVSGDATGSGSISDLLPGEMDSSSINVGVDTSSPGSKSGTVEIDLESVSNSPTTYVSQELDFQTQGQSIYGPNGIPFPGTIGLLNKTVGSLGSPSTLSIGPYSESLAGTASAELSASLGFLASTAKVDYPVDASVEFPSSVEPGDDFTVDTGDTGHGEFDLSTYFAGLADASLSASGSANFTGSGSLFPPFTFGVSLGGSIGVMVSNPQLTIGDSNNQISEPLAKFN